MGAFLCLALIWCATAGVPAQDRVHLPAEVELARLVDLSAERLGLRIAYEQRQLAGSFMVRSGAGLDDQELWALTNELLVQKNLTTISTGDGLAIVQLNGAARLATPTEQWTIEDTESGPKLRTADRAGYVAVLYDIREASAESLMSAVQPLLSAGGSVTRLGSSDRMIVADLRNRVGRAVTLMRTLDVRTTVTRSYEPRVFSPGEVGEAVRRLIGEEVRVVADELTGTLLVEATSSQHERSRHWSRDWTPRRRRRGSRPERSRCGTGPWKRSCHW